MSRVKRTVSKEVVGVNQSAECREIANGCAWHIQAVAGTFPASKLPGKVKGHLDLWFRGPLNYRSDWIGTSDLLYPIYRVKAGPSRRMSQMQAFW